MADKDDGLTHLLKFFEFMIAFRLKENIPYRQRFVHDQDLRIDIDRHRKGKTHKHTAGIGLHRLVDIFADIRKFQNRIQLLIDFFLRKSDHGSVQIDIFNPIILIIKACSQFQQRRNTSIDGHAASAGVQNACNDFQDC